MSIHEIMMFRNYHSRGGKVDFCIILGGLKKCQAYTEYRRTKYLILFLQGCSCSCCCGFWRNFRDIFKIHEVCDISDNVLSHSRLISSLYLIIAVLGGPCLRQSQGNRQRNSQETSAKWLSSNNEKLRTRISFASEQSNEFDQNKLTTW